MSQTTSVTRNKNVTTQKLTLDTEEECADNLEDQLVEKSQKLDGNSDDDEIVVVDSCPVATRLGRLTAKEYMMSTSVFPETDDFVFSVEPNSFCQMMRAHMKTDTFVILIRTMNRSIKHTMRDGANSAMISEGSSLGNAKLAISVCIFFCSFFVFHHDILTLFFYRFD